MELNVEKNGNWWVGLVVFPEEPSAEAKSRQLKLTVINGSVLYLFPSAPAEGSLKNLLITTDTRQLKLTEIDGSVFYLFPLASANGSLNKNRPATLSPQNLIHHLFIGNGKKHERGGYNRRSKKIEMIIGSLNQTKRG